MVGDFTRQNAESMPDVTREYMIKDLIGCGRNGEVRKCLHKKSGQYRAVKIFKRKDDNEQVARQQIDALKTLDHPNVLKFYEAYKDEKKMFMVTEICPGGELFDVIENRGRPFTEKEASDIMYQIMLAVNYIHLNDIIHRNIQPENILVE